MVPRLRVTVGEAVQMVLKRLIAFGDPLLVGVVHRDFLLEDEYEVIYMAVTEVDEYEGICELNDDGLAPSRLRTHQNRTSLLYRIEGFHFGRPATVL